MVKSAPVMFAAAVAGEEGDEVAHLLRRGEPAGDALAAAAPATTPGSRRWPGDGRGHAPAPSQRSVATGPGLIVLTRMPCGPTSFDSDLQKLVSAALAAL